MQIGNLENKWKTKLDEAVSSMASQFANKGDVSKRLKFLEKKV